MKERQIDYKSLSTRRLLLDRGSALCLPLCLLHADKGLLCCLLHIPNCPLNRRVAGLKARHRIRECVWWTKGENGKNRSLVLLLRCLCGCCHHAAAGADFAARWVNGLNKKSILNSYLLVLKRRAK
ncbi:Hypothetical protein GLP15_5024 [Giardia lamblia P15]|uniref:Uncharacterized protein n=1 Tax=Giardia intestinalis (strain P15) TaxID=658858 RepID=E1EWL8_GIAIA|nr:Hypothetical protein GLP15_5024 [Giardia lamblia P15]